MDQHIIDEQVKDLIEGDRKWVRTLHPDLANPTSRRRLALAEETIKELLAATIQRDLTIHYDPDWINHPSGPKQWRINTFGGRGERGNGETLVDAAIQFLEDAGIKREEGE